MPDTPQTQPVPPYAQWGLVVVFVLICTLVNLGLTGGILAPVILPLLDLMLFGGLGGILYAIRTGDLDSPRFVLLSSSPEGPVDNRYVIRLGWIADILHGFAGAIVVFLILPEMAKLAGEVFEKLAAMKLPSEKNPPQPPIGLDAHTVSSFLQVIGVATLGGFAGKALIQRATDALLQKKVDQAIEGLGARGTGG